jgi:hypothetical protein
MDTFLPKGFEAGPTRSKTSRQRRVAQLSVASGGVIFPVLRRWATGFAVSAADVPTLSGVVDLYDGAEHLHQCLIIRCERLDDENVFIIKRSFAVDYSSVFQIDTDSRAGAT